MLTLAEIKINMVNAAQGFKPNNLHTLLLLTMQAQDYISESCRNSCNTLAYTYNLFKKKKIYTNDNMDRHACLSACSIENSVNVRTDIAENTCMHI